MARSRRVGDVVDRDDPAVGIEVDAHVATVDPVVRTADS
jgi:hypothetical protein